MRVVGTLPRVRSLTSASGMKAGAAAPGQPRVPGGGWMHRFLGRSATLPGQSLPASGREGGGGRRSQAKETEGGGPYEMISSM